MKSLIGVLMTLFACGAALAGALSPDLDARLAGKGGDVFVRVLVVLQDRIDISGLDAELRDAQVSLKERHRIVVETLQAKAAQAQTDLLSDLAARTATGAVKSYRAHWLLNAVVVDATVAAVREIASRWDVSVVEADLAVEIIGPVPAGKSAPADKDYGIGVAPGVRAIDAPRVWYELGVDGSGALVANLDSGVNLTHPALAGGWRGNTAPAGECWLDAAGLDMEMPDDLLGHGSHVMGTIAGVAPDDTIGVAPGAQWIASNGTWAPSSEALISMVLASLEFFTDPDGDPATIDDVPDVVQNSWGVNGGFEGFDDCDTHWWDAIDACEAAGVVLLWSAGNNGPFAGSMNSPADRATTALNCFSVGSVAAYAPYAVSDFSSRGPSDCGGDSAVKPEITAPGEDIYSAYLGDSYYYMSGTSMSGPHVAGVVALMRAADPDLDVNTIKQVLLDTATDLGPAGEENDYGHGLVNAYAAVLAIIPGYGDLEGLVTDALGGTPLAGATVAASADGALTRYTTTDGNGFYHLDLPAGEWTVEAVSFAYATGQTSATVPLDGLGFANLALDLGPTVEVTGQVLLPSVMGAPGAEVRVVGRPVAPAVTDAAGDFVMTLPVGYDYVFLATLDGYLPKRKAVRIDAAVYMAFVLDEMGREGFERGNLSFYPWVLSGEGDWAASVHAAHEGFWSAMSGPTADFKASTMSVELEFPDGEISFWYKVSSEEWYDYLLFYIDDELAGAWSGDVDWAQAVFAVAPGPHLYSWSYAKDGAVADGVDAAWIDLIGAPMYPALGIRGPMAVNKALASGETSSQALTLVNDGEADLEVSLYAYTVAPLDTASATHGGPDIYGHFWRDSDDPAGPAYDWLELAGVGDAHAFGDDETMTFALPFPFTFYGQTFSELNVCSNGWASLDSGDNDNLNMPIPHPDTPNNLLAPFWDDLAPHQGGTVYTWSDTAGGRFVVQWDHVPFYNVPHYQTFELVLSADGGVVFQYQDIRDRVSASVGIENGAGDDGLQVSFNQAYLHDEMAIAFIPPLDWLEVAPAAFTVPVGGEMAIEVSLDAAGLPDGAYLGYVHVVSNAHERPERIIPVGLFVTGTTGVEAGAPQRYMLGAATPNPFNPSTRIEFAVPAGGGRVELAVYDLAGRLVRRLAAGEFPAGRQEVVWRGDDQGGRCVPSGTYVYRLLAGDFRESRKMMLIK
ncbi:S8 family serine peptidase [bacterium]|nr:S8 family serine peptidase [bacterium]MBU1073188.1 S8 family serine peptidase [bacterium]